MKDIIRGAGQLRAAVIGLGVGERHIAGYQADPRCRVVALCDTDPRKLGDVQLRYPGLLATTKPEEILEDPSIDIVSIASHDDFHRDQIVAALSLGKHVFAEKPLCLSRAEYRDILLALKNSNGPRLSSNLILRKEPRFVELRNRIRAEKFGNVYYLEGDYDYGRIEKIVGGWRGELAGFSVVHSGGIHLIDLLLWLSASQVVQVFAYGTRIATESTRFRNNDTVVAILKFADGMLGKVSANFACVTPHHHRVSVYGTEATFEQGHLGAAYFSSRDAAVGPELETDAYPAASKGDILPSFVRSILDGSPADVTEKEVFDAMNVSLAIEESLLAGKPVDLEYEDWDAT